MSAAMLEVGEAEVSTWPGVWAVTRTYAGWIVYADPNAPETAVAAARKLANTTGRTVVVQHITLHPDTGGAVAIRSEHQLDES